MLVPLCFYWTSISRLIKSKLHNFNKNLRRNCIKFNWAVTVTCVQVLNYWLKIILSTCEFPTWKEIWKFLLQQSMYFLVINHVWVVSFTACRSWGQWRLITSNSHFLNVFDHSILYTCICYNRTFENNTRRRKNPPTNCTQRT